MSHEVFQKQIYVSLLEILRDEDLYRQSMIDTKYNKFSEAGKEALLEYMVMMAPVILQKEKQELDKRAKQLVVEELKR
jgi:hypothetical protein